MIRVLNMAPSTNVRDKTWFTKPWKLEKEDCKYMAYVQSRILALGKDGDGEVMRESTAAEEREIVFESADLEVDVDCMWMIGWIQPNL